MKTQTFRILPSFDLAKARKLHKRITFGGMDISVENAAGTIRRWYDPHGKESGSTKMLHDYGYIRRTEGTDGDHVDVYVGPDKDSERVFIVNQKKLPDFKEFDEQKVMLGFKTPEAAKKAYLAHYNDPRFFGSMIAMRLKDFKERVFSKEMKGIAIQASKKVMVLPPVALMKSEKPPAGFQPVGKKGGYKKMIGGKWIYWYPGQPHPAAARSSEEASGSKTSGKPVPVRERAPAGAESGKKLPKFEASRAKEGSAVWKMENGVFAWKTARVFDRSQDEHQMRRTDLVPGVDDETKLALISEFRPLLISEGKKTRRLFALKDRFAIGEGRSSNETQEELMRAGVEGLLRAIHTYKADVPFAYHANMYVRDYMRLHAAKEFMGGIELPDMHVRNLSRYIAARARAAKELGKHDPTPREVVPFFDLRKKHIHAGLPSKGANGEELRNAQLPEFEGYKLGLGQRGSVTKRSDGGSEEEVDTQEMRDVATQPSKLQWAEMYDGFLRGQKGVGAFDEQVIFPGAGEGVGFGFSPEEQVELRQQVKRAADRIKSMGSHSVTITTAWHKEPTQFRVDDLGDIVMKRLGVGNEPLSARDLAQEIPVYRVGEDGKEKALGFAMARAVMQTFIDEGMKKLQQNVDGRAKGLVDRAKDLVAPEQRAEPGPTYNEMLRTEAKQVSAEQVRAWRDEQSKKLAGKERALSHVRDMSDDEVKLEVAKRSRRMKKTTEAMKRLMTQTIEVERIDPHYGVAYMYDPEQKTHQSVRVRMNYIPDYGLKKAMEGVTDQMIREAANFPELMNLMIGEHEPSPERTIVQRMFGWY